MPEDWVFELFQEAAFPGQAIGRTVLGTPESIRAHTAGDLRRFLGAHYCGPQIVVAAAGNVDHDELVRLAEEHLGRLPGHQPAAPGARPLQGRRADGSAPGARRRRSCSASPRRPTPTALFAATHLFSAILGGGMASRLFQELRENRGLCYSIYSFYWPFDGYRAVRHPGGDVGGRCRGTGAGRARRASAR